MARIFSGPSAIAEGPDKFTARAEILSRIPHGMCEIRNNLIQKWIKQFILNQIRFDLNQLIREICRIAANFPRTRRHHTATRSLCDGDTRGRFRLQRPSAACLKRRHKRSQKLTDPWIGAKHKGCGRSKVHWKTPPKAEYQTQLWSQIWLRSQPHMSEIDQKWTQIESVSGQQHIKTVYRGFLEEISFSEASF